MATFLLLTMLSLILYDAGVMLRAKVESRASADTAAYSAAATQARAMNMIAYGNVGKRTIVGIHNMYFFQYPYYMLWWAGQCSSCCCGWTCGCWTQCFNCWGNAASLIPILEGIDYIQFLFSDDLEENLEEIHDFQREAAEYARYWATGEGMTRGVRNGAHLIGMYPEPDTPEYGALPLFNSGWANGGGFWGRYRDRVYSCSAPVLLNPSTAMSTLEYLTNFAELVDRSTSSPNIASSGPAEVVQIWLAQAACLAITPFKANTEHIFLTRTSNDRTEPRQARNSSEHLLATSNVVYTYRHEPKIFDELRDNYDINVHNDYTGTSLTGGMLPKAGVWSIARSEFYMDDLQRPPYLGFARDNWMYHTAWVGKLRPMMLRGEAFPASHDFADQVSASFGTAQSMASGVWGMPFTPGFDGLGYFQDANFFRNNAAQDMNGIIDSNSLERHALVGAD